MQARVLVSACLLGKPCRYDGSSKPLPELRALLGDAIIVPVCPEELGGLGTPRPASELRGGTGTQVWAGLARVHRLEDDGDVTQAFLMGARLARATAPEASRAILKARSPSCGCGMTHIEGQLRPGDGVFAALLRGEGVVLQTDEALLNTGAWSHP